MTISAASDAAIHTVRFDQGPVLLTPDEISCGSSAGLGPAGLFPDPSFVDDLGRLRVNMASFQQ
jgi:hypothetical protein